MLIDSNILIYALNSNSPKHSLAQKFLQQHDITFVVAHQNIIETLRVLTHHKFSTPFKPKRALTAVEQIISQCSIIYPNGDTLQTSIELIKKYSISGSEIFDAYLVATALTNGITTIATDNVKHLKKYVEAHIVNPFNTSL